RLPHHSERLWQQVIKPLATRQPAAERTCQGLEPVLGPGLQLRAQGIDLRDNITAPPQDPRIVRLAGSGRPRRTEQLRSCHAILQPGSTRTKHLTEDRTYRQARRRQTPRTS